MTATNPLNLSIFSNSLSSSVNTAALVFASTSEVCQHLHGCCNLFAHKANKSQQLCLVAQKIDHLICGDSQNILPLVRVVFASSSPARLLQPVCTQGKQVATIVPSKSSSSQFLLPWSPARLLQPVCTQGKQVTTIVPVNLSFSQLSKCRESLPPLVNLQTPAQLQPVCTQS